MYIEKKLYDRRKTLQLRRIHCGGARRAPMLDPCSLDIIHPTGMLRRGGPNVAADDAFVSEGGNAPELQRVVFLDRLAG